MNDLQKKELELLNIFADICKKIETEYYLVCGSALGAVKYNGFIPWDDDIDVGMRREEYSRFVNEAPKYLPDGIFLQTYISDPQYPCIYAKLRDSRTTLIEKSSANLDINHGIFIDIFPLDGYPKGRLSQKILAVRKKLCKLKITASFDGDYSPKVRLIRKAFRFLGVHKRNQKNTRKYERLISRYPTDSSSVWCNHGNWQKKLEYAPKEQYGKGTAVIFEGLRVKVPENYDEYLTQKYGDWRRDPPLEKQVSHHDFVMLDLERPYTEYLKKS